ncbi:hypothetical protein CEP54_000940 [Fusarium duplospermum]|uniref:Uncharacterized protein n=1 Tax=Fusarium duplospermum TaxID=1325734 RepID=A0A428R4B4_9HYPO|nr:hypothetical protein CEP54_000940 [Fusarium duplospermum]
MAATRGKPGVTPIHGHHKLNWNEVGFEAINHSLEALLSLQLALEWSASGDIESQTSKFLVQANIRLTGIGKRFSPVWSPLSTRFNVLGEKSRDDEVLLGVTKRSPARHELEHESSSFGTPY